MRERLGIVFAILVYSNFSFSAEAVNFRNEVLNIYAQLPQIKTILASEAKLIAGISQDYNLSDKANVSYYRFVLDLGYKFKATEAPKYGYFSKEALFIFDCFTNANLKIECKDVTSAPFPNQEIWVQYSVSSTNTNSKIYNGKIKQSSFPNLKFSFGLRKVTDGLAQNLQLGNVFFKINDNLKLDYRKRVLSGYGPNTFHMNKDGVLDSLVENSVEEGDGPLEFGLHGGGVTGWNPWSGKFIDVVEKPGSALKTIKSAREALVPALIIP